MSADSALSGLLRRDRLAVTVGLAGAVALSWTYLVSASLDMYGAMEGPAAWMMHATWDGRYFFLIFLMWAVMMVGMMLPSAMPTVQIYLAVVRRSSEPRGRPVFRAYAFAGGYLLVWGGFSLVATVLQWALARASLLTPMMESASPVLAGAVLAGAGLYQWSPLKQVCLTQCRSPMAFLMSQWRPGSGGALHMGLRHGIYCLGCCWALMLLLFVGGVMSLLWIGVIAIFVMLEKLAPSGAWVGRITGAALIAAGAAVAMSAA